MSKLCAKGEKRDVLTIQDIAEGFRPEYLTVEIDREFGKYADQGVERQRGNFEEVGLSNAQDGINDGCYQE